MGLAKRYTNLRVWQISHQVTLGVYRLTKTFPADERFRLVHQMTKAAVSMSANIAEGFGRRSSRDKARFCEIAKTSADELDYYFILAGDLEYIKDCSELTSKLDSVGAMLYRLMEAVLGDE